MPDVRFAGGEGGLQVASATGQYGWCASICVNMADFVFINSGVALFTIDSVKYSLEIREMMDPGWVDWFPIIFFPLKILVLGVGMYYSIKWHYDQDKKKKEADGQRAVAGRKPDAKAVETAACDAQNGPSAAPR